MKKIVFVCLMGVFLLTAASSWATPIDSTTFNLVYPNTAISPYTGPYASVTVDLNSYTSATITFDALTNGSNIYLLGSNSAVAVNVNGSFTLGAITGSNLYDSTIPGFDTPGGFTSDPNKNADGFGTFNQTIDSFDSFTHSATEISFDLTKTIGTWASASDVLALNSNGNLAAAHILVWDGTSDGALATGYAGNGGYPVPEPVTMILLGIGLIGLVSVRQKFLKS